MIYNCNAIWELSKAILNIPLSTVHKIPVNLKPKLVPNELSILVEFGNYSVFELLI